jgi:hypothetical protein
VNANLLDECADTEVLDNRADHLKRELGEVVKEGTNGRHGTPNRHLGFALGNRVSMHGPWVR